MRSSDLLSGSANTVGCAGARLVVAKAEPGLGLVIAKTLAPVVPMRIFGAREALPRGGGRLHFVPITIVIGEAIVFTAADLNSSGKSLYRNLSERVMEAIATLRLD